MITVIDWRTVTREQILVRLRDILTQQFSVDAAKFRPDATFHGTFAMESLDVIDLIEALEEQFHIDEPIAAYRELHTVDKLVDFIMAKTAG